MTRTAIVVCSGLAGLYRQHPIKVPVGELARASVVKMLEYESLVRRGLGNGFLI